jgi:hypothetical protein
MSVVAKELWWAVLRAGCLECPTVECLADWSAARKAFCWAGPSAGAWALEWVETRAASMAGPWVGCWADSRVVRLAVWKAVATAGSKAMQQVV